MTQEEAREQARREFIARMDEPTRQAMTEVVGYALRVQGEAPPVGAPAFDFALKRLGSEEQVRLSEHRGRPVGLIFGSYT